MGSVRTFLVSATCVGLTAQTMNTKLYVSDRSSCAKAGLALAHLGTTSSVVSPQFIFSKSMIIHPPACSFKPIFEPKS